MSPPRSTKEGKEKAEGKEKEKWMYLKLLHIDGNERRSRKEREVKNIFVAAPDPEGRQEKGRVKAGRVGRKLDAFPSLHTEPIWEGRRRRAGRKER